MLIIFDLDDTLIDTSGCITPIKLERALRALINQGLQVASFEAALKQWMQLDKKSSSAKESLSQFLKTASQEREDFFKAGIKEIYKSTLEGIEVKPLRGAIEALKKLFQSHDLALVSVGREEEQLEKLVKAGIDPRLFKKIFITQEENKEPYYKKIFSQFPVKSKSVIVCGDRIKRDLAPAKHLGFNTVQMKWGRGLLCRDIENIVDFEISSMSELVEIIARLEKE